MGDENGKAIPDRATARKPEPVNPNGTPPQPAEKQEKDQEIEIKQVPMDGICGGY